MLAKMYMSLKTYRTENIAALLFGVLLSYCVCKIGPSCVEGAVVCPAEKIPVLDPLTGRTVGCRECKWCPAGAGSSATCGSSVRKNTIIHCVPCVTAKTYSPDNSTSACSDCTDCGPHRAVTHNCTATSDTQCGKCDRGFYPDGVTGMCQPCSFCCGDVNDYVMKKCSADGMVTTQQCSYERSEYCKARMTRPSPHASTRPLTLPVSAATGNSTGRNTTEEPGSTEKLEPREFARIVSGSVFAFMVLVGIIIKLAALLWRWKKRKLRKPEQETAPASKEKNTTPVQETEGSDASDRV